MWSTHILIWCGVDAYKPISIGMFFGLFVFWLCVSSKLYGSCWIRLRTDHLISQWITMHGLLLFSPYFIIVFAGINHLSSCYSATMGSHFVLLRIFLIKIMHLRSQKIWLMKLTLKNADKFTMNLKSQNVLGICCVRKYFWTHSTCLILLMQWCLRMLRMLKSSCSSH